MNRLATCIQCEDTKPISDFVVADGRRTKICIECGLDEVSIQDTVEISDEFTEEIKNMGEDFIPVDELTLPDE